MTSPIQSYRSLDEMFLERVPEYRGYGWRPFLVKFKWDPSLADFMETVSAKRCAKRRDSYLIPGELKRATQSIRFGMAKTGRGYREKRGDFCLIGGAWEEGKLTLFYRRVELIGGLHFDLAVIKEVEEWMGPIKTVTVMAVGAKVFALARGSNEKLYARLMEFYRGRAQ